MVCNDRLPTEHSINITTAVNSNASQTAIGFLDNIAIKPTNYDSHNVARSD
jgi:hypothetical protein